MPTEKMVKLINDDCFKALKTLEANSIDSLVTDPPAGITFTGAEWDEDKGGRTEWINWMRSVMRECYRVMKPGAHGLVWAIPRTSHWTSAALEHAGFEIRDCITHIFGSGFPKSTDIGKQIDKLRGAERKVVGKKKYSAPDIRGNSYDSDVSDRKRLAVDITEAATPHAKEWEGWGTALKPATEQYWLVRRPLAEKTATWNVLKWKTGALNIDASRISPTPDYGRSAANAKGTVNAHNGMEGKAFKIAERDGDYASELGRFPSNLIIDDFIQERLEESGRYFYCAKISAAERGDSTHPTMKTQKLMRYLCTLITPKGGTILDPFMGSGSTGVAALKDGFSFVGIEKEKEFYEICKKRIK